MTDLKQLFDTAELYGNVIIFGDKRKSPPNCYSCSITFNTIKHVALEAESANGLSIESALLEAIKNAVLVVDSVSGQVSNDEIVATKLLLKNNGV